MTVDVRTDWSVEEVRTLYHTPLLDLVFEAASVHRRHHDPREVQCCTLLSVKTGGCPEDCAYCSQSARYRTDVTAQRLLSVDEVRAHAGRAREAGSTRFCMGAAWRHVKDGRDFEQLLAMVREVRALGLEACCTLGMLSAAQARRLAEAGLTAYNHNLDTSPDFYSHVVRTHTYEERIETLERRLHAARVLTSDEPSSRIVSLGSHVVIEDVGDGVREEYVLVSSAESNPAEGRISNESPVGRAIAGHREGDVVDAHAPHRVRHLRIVCLHAGPQTPNRLGTVRKERA